MKAIQYIVSHHVTPAGTASLGRRPLLYAEDNKLRDRIPSHFDDNLGEQNSILGGHGSRIAYSGLDAAERISKFRPCGRT